MFKVVFHKKSDDDSDVYYFYTPNEAYDKFHVLIKQGFNATSIQLFKGAELITEWKK